MPEIARYEFRKHANADARRLSAIRLVKLLLEEDPEFLPEHREEFLSLALWKVTEAESIDKHRTQFCSKAVYESPNCARRHDHVYQRAKMVRALIKVGQEGAKEILEKAVACTITKEEHLSLNAYEHVDGWERYRRAGIVVIDGTTGALFEFPEA